MERRRPRCRPLVNGDGDVAAPAYRQHGGFIVGVDYAGEASELDSGEPVAFFAVAAD